MLGPESKLQRLRSLKRPLAFVLVAILLALQTHFFVACISNETCGQVEVFVRLVDDETGEPVSRNGNYVHAYNDAQDLSVMLEPGDGDRFELCMQEPEIRLLIPDGSGFYKVFEQSFTAKDGVLDIEVRLKRAHGVRLYGTMLWEDASGDLHPLSEGSGNIRHVFLGGMPSGSDLSDDGQYSVRKPRELLEFRSINTSYYHSPMEVDLRGVTEDEYELNFVFKPGPGQEY